jgi:hypothetical protein
MWEMLVVSSTGRHIYIQIEEGYQIDTHCPPQDAML